MKQVVGLIFSKDRAMQLDATIRSFLLHCRDLEKIDIKIIWKTTDFQNEEQYQELVRTYPDIEFIREVDFEGQVLESMAGYEYVLFLVDDNIFVRPFDLGRIVESIGSNPDVLGFSLRLGINTKYCYPLRVDQQLPSFTKSTYDFLKFDWTAAQYDFSYPLEVSSSVYRVKDMIAVLHQSFINPNTLEAYLDNRKSVFAFLRKFLLCYEHSCTFCNPVNKVQHIFNNRAGERFYYSPKQLQELFCQGCRVDVEVYRDFIPNACHQEVELKFEQGALESIAVRQEGTPKVSVVMPVYNGQDYLREAIDSILCQTFTDFELIIIDDGSTDQSLEIIKAYQDPRIVLVCNEANLKLIATLNKGFAIAQGQYIARMDADDISLPGRLARQVEFMDQHPTVGVCGTWTEVFGAGEESFWRFSDNPNLIKCMLLFGCCMVHPSVMVRRGIFGNGLSYSSQYPHAEDYALWVQIAEKYEVVNIPEVLLKYRKSINQVSSKYSGQQLGTTFVIQREQLSALGIEPTAEEAFLHWEIGVSQFTPNLSFVSSAFLWLSKLREANSRVHYYPEPEFQNLLHLFWIGICNQLINAF